MLPVAAVARIVATCRSAFTLLPGAEVTMEANPTSVDEAVFAGLLEAGINRLSLGVQTQHRRGLRTLGRNHEAAEAAAAYRAARAAGFANISLDLIFAWPGQTPEILAADLEAVLGWDPAPEHLSCYSLIVEPGTPMADAVARGILAFPDDDASADLYELVIETLARAGYTHYEVANWARAQVAGPGLPPQPDLLAQWRIRRRWGGSTWIHERPSSDAAPATRRLHRGGRARRTACLQRRGDRPRDVDG